MSKLVLPCAGVFMAWSRGDRETRKVSGPQPDMVAMFQKEKNSPLQHSLVACSCCTFIGVCEATLYTHEQCSYQKWNWSPVTENQKNMFEAVCLESTGFLGFISAPLGILSVFHCARMIAFFHIALNPKKITYLVEKITPNSFSSYLCSCFGLNLWVRTK